MFYTYILKSGKDGKMYTGSTNNLRLRFEQHQKGKVESTKYRGPLTLIYYEACVDEDDARRREKVLKSYRGKMFIKNRLKSYFTGLTRGLLIALFILFAHTTYASAPTMGLVGYWAFDEQRGTVAADSSGSGNTGTLTNGPVWTAGKVNGGLSFDGSDDYIAVPYNASSFNFSTTNFTISTWVYINSQTTQTIWGSADVFSNIEFALVDQGPYNMALWNGAEWQYSNTSISTGWHHLTVVRTSTTEVKWYLDGSADGTSSFANGSWSNGTDIRWIADGFRGNLNGKLDEVRVYSRALSAQEILDIYNDTGTPPPVDTTAPSIPTGLSATAVSSSQINLSWTASTDNIGVTGYDIYRGGTLLASVTGTTYPNTGLSPSTLYSYSVRAKDAAGNASSQSLSASATTQAQSSGNIKEVGSGQTYSTISACITAASAGDICNVHAGSYAGFTLSKAITVRANSGDSPAITSAITITSSNSILDGFDVTSSSCTLAGLVYAEGLTNITIKNNKLHGCMAADGVGVYVRNSTKVAIDNNAVYSNAIGIKTISCHSTDGTYANGCVVSNNMVHDNYNDGLEVHGQYHIISGNNVYNNIDTNWANTHPDGIQLIAGTADGYTANQHFRIYNNIFRNHTQNIFSEGTVGGQSSDTSDIWVFNNVAYNDGGTVNGVNLDSLGNTSFMLKFSRDVYVFNNYFGKSGSAGNSVHVQDCYNGSIHIKNNMFVNPTQYGIYVEDPSDISSGELNYNLYFTGSTEIVWGSTFYDSVSQFHSAIPSQETNGLNVNPLVNSIPAPTLQLGSPAINAGINLNATYCAINSALCADKAGISRPSTGPWDIGAYQYTGGGTPPPTPLPGDLNLDHIVNALDYSLLNSKWLQSFSAYDLQADGLINSLDFAILSSNWGRTW